MGYHELDLVGRGGGNLEKITGPQRLEGCDCQLLAVQDGIDHHRGCRGGAAHLDPPEVVGLIGGGVYHFVLDRGPDRIEGRERQDEAQVACPRGLADVEGEIVDQHVDIIRRNPHLGDVLALRGDGKLLGDRTAEAGSDGGHEGGAHRLERQPAERHVDAGEGAGDRNGGRGMVAAEHQVDEVKGEIGVDGEQPLGLAVLDLDETKTLSDKMQADGKR